MANVEVVFKSKKVDAFLKKVSDKTDDALDLKRAFAAGIISPIIKDITRHFEQERGPKGPWKKWSTSYSDQMTKKGKGGNKILQDTGRLKRGVKPINWRRDPKGLLIFNPEKTKSGFPYAAAHDEGGSKLPQRRFMWISKKAFNQVAQTTSRFILAGVIR